jgi:hypothetical protein
MYALHATHTMPSHALSRPLCFVLQQAQFPYSKSLPQNALFRHCHAIAIAKVGIYRQFREIDDA